MTPALEAYSFGALALLTFLFMGSVAGRGNPLELATGADGRLSTSKFQWFLWNGAGIFAIVTVLYWQLKTGGKPSGPPASLLLTMGFSTITMAGAKAITTSYINSGSIVKPSAPDAIVSRPAGQGPTGAPKPAGGALSDDSGAPDLSKVQLTTFTLIGIGAFLWQFFADGGKYLKDIDPTLMVLMGMSQGGYLGKKLVTTNTPRLAGITPSSGPSGTQVTVKGVSLGGAGSVVLLDGGPLTSAAQFNDDGFKFTIPLRRPNGDAWTEGQRIDVGVIADGRQAANTLPFTIGKSQDPARSDRLG